MLDGTSRMGQPLPDWSSESRVRAGCPAVCECPATRPSCPPGVSMVRDACGCCKVCAAQLNQDCHAMQPCDHHKGLECNYGNDVGSTHGICRAKLEGRSCEYNGRMYQNGENFRAGCKHQCTCVDGAVGCVPLCPTHLPLASPSCPAPRLVRVPGQCCPSLDCHKSSSALPPVVRKPDPPPLFFQDLLPYPKPYPEPSYPKPYPEPSYPKQYFKRFPHKAKDTLSNELMEEGKRWDKPHSHKHLAAWRQEGKQCVVQTTNWSQCSRSCGMGVSSRVTNNNAQCKLVKETRLCNIRPCSSMSVPIKKGRKCSRTQKAPEPLRLHYAGCRSVRLYRPNYCGVCLDGRCCSPRRTRTAAVRFSCPDGERFERSVMFVQSCKCSDECSHLNEAALPPQRWLYGDTHKFID
ncbi:CCN family member 1 isoform X1 [Alosa alosa]|uniref:CCN family member 1 isoform X1 n=2 Tax=Alosa alosa TaxID=278164 RepID=UPI002015500A|nr:CCN family member 1 isoform X1 [Alosa alosa]XP_048101941.1 CCN family member 1 isoform X1 [Alosa alosa]XP_048101942.1 CCN family member 1 isoform X1 [Alosa alosa]